ncbi:MAG: patatin-like phospholipase family protein [Pseudomonadota bacterium]
MTEKVVKKVNLALQGGGSHGAFTWGVIDQLMADGRLEIEAIVGTSAGAMNAAVTAYGMCRGGGEGVRQTLDMFWRRISEEAAKGPLQPTYIDKMVSRGNMDFSPFWIFYDNLSRLASPYQLNPGNFNPLRDVLNEVVDFDIVRRSQAVKLFTCATNVKTGKIKVFRQHEMSAEAVLASACLPFVFKAVEIDGEHYWDGGYMGNPPIYPLIYNTECEDILIIQINPINIPEVPRTAHEIFDRINTLSFNSSLMREMRAISFVTKLIDTEVLDRNNYKRLNIHTIEAENEFANLGVSSKLNASTDFLDYLHDLGRQHASAFLDAHFEKIGVESSADIGAQFL